MQNVFPDEILKVEQAYGSNTSKTSTVPLDDFWGKASEIFEYYCKYLWAETDCYSLNL